MEQENVGPSLLQTETIPDTDRHSEETSVSVDSIVNENKDGGTKAIITNIKIGNEAESSVNDNRLDLDINGTDGDQSVSDLKVGEDAVDIANTDGASANDYDDDDDLPAPPDDVLQTHEDEKKLNFDDEPDPEPEIPEPEPEPPFEPEPEPFGVRAGVGNPDEPEPEPEPVGVRAGVGNPDEPEPEPEPEAHFGRAQVGEPDEPEPEPEPEVRAVLPDEPEPEPEPEVRAVLPDEPEPEPEPGVKSAHDYHPRLCHLIKRADFNGYGFNLHGEKDVQGQYIGLVDDNSPAERAGLKKGDRIIEVNGENTESSSHQQVIMQIKSGGDETKLLVVDKVTDDYYKNNGLEIKASLPEVVYKSSETKDTTEMTYTPRSCHIIKWPDFNGYGFNLHAEKERGGQYIGKIDDNSPAQDAGLKERDRIIEVNGVNVEDMTHREVITKIKEGGDETRLLVVDPAADSYYKSRGVTVSSTMSGVKFLQTSRRSPAVSGVTNGESRPARTEPVQNSAPVQANGGGDFLSMNLSAKEMRERIASKKKADPKQRSNMDFKTKYDMFQKL